MYDKEFSTTLVRLSRELSDDGLSNQEVCDKIQLEKDEMITSILYKIDELNNHICRRSTKNSFPIKKYTYQLNKQPQHIKKEAGGVIVTGPDTVYEEHIFNKYDVCLNFFGNGKFGLKSVRDQIIEFVISKIWEIIFNADVAEFYFDKTATSRNILAGDAYEVAFKASAELFYGYRSWCGCDDNSYILDCVEGVDVVSFLNFEDNQELLNIGLSENMRQINLEFFAKSVGKDYEEKFSRYKLWTQDTLCRLEYELFESGDEPAIGYYLPENGEIKLKIDEFITEVAEVIMYDFPDYVPADHMSKSAIEYLYKKYLNGNE